MDFRDGTDGSPAGPKVTSAFNETNAAQMLGYLNITGLEWRCSSNSRNHDLHGSVWCAGNASAGPKNGHGWHSR
jgi:hypothetical protein